MYRYLLRGMDVSQPDQVWAMDITYIPMARGFVYLAAVVDWHSRRVLSWRVSISMDTAFCIEAVEEALANTELLKQHNIEISMDGKGGVARQRLRGTVVAKRQV